MKSGSENHLAHARTFPAKCVFFLHFLHKIGYRLVKQWFIGEGFIFPNPSPEGGNFERMVEEVKEVKEKTRNLYV